MLRRRENEAGRKTEEGLLDAAERLFARYGPEAVSLRQIAIEAGSSNNFAVQYHFKDKPGLVEALFERRLATLEERRGELLRQIRCGGAQPDTRDLLEVMLRPLIEILDRDGNRCFAEFSLSLRHYDKDFNLLSSAGRISPMTAHIADLLCESVPHLTRTVARHRLAMVSTLFLSSIARWDHLVAAGEADVLPWEDELSQALEMAAGAYVAPIRRQRPFGLNPEKMECD